MVDEYGGIVGFVIFEDFVEEFVGEVFDEYDCMCVGVICNCEGIMFFGELCLDEL